MDVDDLIVDNYNQKNPYHWPEPFKKSPDVDEDACLKRPEYRHLKKSHYEITYKYKTTQTDKSVLPMDVDCEYLSYYMPKVRRIYFKNGGTVSRVESLYKLQKLEELHFLDCAFYSLDLSKLQNKENFKVLILNRILNLDFNVIKEFPNLETLVIKEYFGKTFLTDISFLLENDKLKTFIIDERVSLDRLPKDQYDKLLEKFENLQDKNKIL